jgi:hypothetical protein
MRILAMSEMAIARVHPAFGDFRFEELSHQLGAFGLLCPRRRLDFCFPFSPTLPRLRPTAVSGRDGMLV